MLFCLMKNIDYKKIIKKISANKKKIKSFGVKKIGLFESLLKGSQKEKGDIDFLVTFDKIDLDNYAELDTFLKKIFRRKIDLVVEKNLVPELRYVKKEGKNYK